ncbi:ABC transporter permease [Amphibacillus sp. Q70]|uniref:ABC transporter permease n=1 Tax=Amphibacillus sp. Q70 TaxID=3453416 RepID=UPI003F864E74
MWGLIKKDFLTISRDRSELLVLLAMPMILIAILGFALGGLMFNGGDLDAIPVALVIENELEEDIDQFEQLLNDQGLPAPAIEQILASVEELDPAEHLQEVLRSPELSDLIDLSEEYQQDEAEEALATDEVLAVITIPEQFSYQTLSAFYLEEEPEAMIDILVQNHEQFQANIVESIISSFTDQYNLELSIAFATGGEAEETAISTADFGEFIHIPNQEPISAFQYYTIGMAMMFAMYVASTVSGNAFKEKTNNTLARLMLIGERPLHYLASKVVSGTVLTMVQLIILFIGSSIFFQTFNQLNLTFLLLMFLNTFVYSLTIGALAALLTAIAVQFNNDAISGIFSGGVVVIFALIGGNMVPVEQMSPFISELGNWTPNGAMMTAYLQLMQGLELSDFAPLLYRVLAVAIICLVVAVAIFPKRRLS